MKVADSMEISAGMTNIERARAEGSDAFKKMFSGMVQERVESLTETLEEMNARQQEIKQLKEQQHFTETIRHVLPDGSILVREYVDGKLDSCRAGRKQAFAPCGRRHGSGGADKNETSTCCAYL